MYLPACPSFAVESELARPSSPPVSCALSECVGEIGKLGCNRETVEYRTRAASFGESGGSEIEKVRLRDSSARTPSDTSYALDA